MDTTFIPTPQDTALLMENAITKTATYNGTSFDNGAGFAPGGVGMPVAVVTNVTARDFTTGDETYTGVLQESDDNVTFTDAGPTISIGGVGVLSIPGFLSKRYSRLKLTLGGTTPSITLSAWLHPLAKAAA